MKKTEGNLINEDFFYNHSVEEIKAATGLSRSKINAIKLKNGWTTGNTTRRRALSDYPNLKEEVLKKNVRELAKFYGKSETCVRNTLLCYGLKCKKMSLKERRGASKGPKELVEYNSENLKWSEEHTLNEFMSHFKVSYPTAVRWCKKHNVNFKRLKQKPFVLTDNLKGLSVKEICKKTGAMYYAVHRAVKLTGMEGKE